MNPSILVVDDSNMLRDMVRFALQEGGYTSLSEASDGAIALERAKSQVFDLIITDVNMPNMNGIDLVKALRTLPVYEKTPILVLTTEGNNEMKTSGKLAGATGWIVKPFLPEQLLKAVGMVLAS